MGSHGLSLMMIGIYDIIHMIIPIPYKTIAYKQLSLLVSNLVAVRLDSEYI